MSGRAGGRDEFAASKGKRFEKYTLDRGGEGEIGGTKKKRALKTVELRREVYHSGPHEDILKWSNTKAGWKIGLGVVSVDIRRERELRNLFARGKD